MLLEQEALVIVTIGLNMSAMVVVVARLSKFMGNMLGLLGEEVDKELEATWVGWLLVMVSEEVSLVLVEALVDMLLLKKLLTAVVG